MLESRSYINIEGCSVLPTPKNWKRLSVYIALHERAELVEYSHETRFSCHESCIVLFLPSTYIYVHTPQHYNYNNSNVHLPCGFQ